jgi:hypothetical protein
MTDRVPLVYFYGIIPGQYYATWPVYIVDDNPDALSFKVAVDDKKSLNQITQETSKMISDNFKNYWPRIRHGLHAISKYVFQSVLSGGVSK